MELCGTNFTIRGQVDDPTVSVLATVTYTNGDTDTLYGMVERNGRFWVDDVPLNGGTNQVSITFSNAASQTTMTNFNVTQSVMTLTMDAVSDPMQLWQPTISLSGTVSDASVSIQVNGVAGTNNGDGTWSAGNVPVNEGGEAIFDLKAIPPGGGDPDLSVNMDKPARLYVKEYKEKDGGDAIREFYTEAGIQTYSWQAHGSCHWTDGVGGDGSFFQDLCETNIDFLNGFEHLNHSEQWSFPPSSWKNVATGTSAATSLDEWNLYGTPGTSSSSETSSFAPPIVLEHCDVELDVGNAFGWPARWSSSGFSYEPGTIGQYHRKADATMELQTGGRAGSHRQKLFCIIASAGKVINQYDYPSSTFDPPTTAIRAEDIYITGQPLGFDGMLWRVYEDNDTIDVTPRIKGDGGGFYTFAMSQSNYRPLVMLSAEVLDPDQVTPSVAPFCVGQTLQFQRMWDNVDGPPGIQSENILWGFDGHFFNAHSNSVPGKTFPDDCSISYFVDPTLLTNETATAWWVSGGHTLPGKVYTATLNISLTAGNGQEVQITSSGKFNMFRPSTSISPVFANVSVLPHPLYGHQLALAETNAQGTVIPGITFFHSISLPPVFSGDIKWVQIVNQAERKTLDTNGAWHEYILPGSGPYLDTTWPYETFDAGGNPTDGPLVPLFGSYVQGIGSNNFDMYMLFQPTGAASTTWVPLRVVNWSWNGTAIADPAWRKTSGSGQPNSNGETEDFPFWKENISHAYFQPDIP
jgi:hypothetical protein